MFAKASYIVLSVASLCLLLLEAPRGRWLTGKPDRGKVEQQARPDSPTSTNNNPTVRSAYFVFIGGYHGGK